MDSTTTTMSESDKYRQFRNFMCNELGITRADVETWTKEAISVEDEKRIGSLANAGINDLLLLEIKRAVANARWDVVDTLRREVANAVAKHLASHIRVEFVPTEEASK